MSQTTPLSVLGWAWNAQIQTKLTCCVWNCRATSSAGRHTAAGQFADILLCDLNRRKWAVLWNVGYFIVSVRGHLRFLLDCLSLIYRNESCEQLTGIQTANMKREKFRAPFVASQSLYRGAIAASNFRCNARRPNYFSRPVGNVVFCGVKLFYACGLFCTPRVGSSGAVIIPWFHAIPSCRPRLSRTAFADSQWRGGFVRCSFLSLLWGTSSHKLTTRHTKSG